MQGKPLGEKVAADQLPFPRRGAGVPGVPLAAVNGRVAEWLAFGGQYRKHNAHVLMFAIKYIQISQVTELWYIFTKILLWSSMFIIVRLSYLELSEIRFSIDNIRFDDK